MHVHLQILKMLHRLMMCREANKHVNGGPFPYHMYIVNTHLQISATMQLTSTASGDILITSSLVHYPLSKRTGAPRSESILQLLIAYTVNVGLLGWYVFQNPHHSALLLTGTFKYCSFDYAYSLRTTPLVNRAT